MLYFSSEFFYDQISKCLHCYYFNWYELGSFNWPSAFIYFKTNRLSGPKGASHIMLFSSSLLICLVHRLLCVDVIGWFLNSVSPYRVNFIMQKNVHMCWFCNLHLMASIKADRQIELFLGRVLMKIRQQERVQRFIWAVSSQSEIKFDSSRQPVETSPHMNISSASCCYVCMGYILNFHPLKKL